jgi:hypothetical protein
MANKKVSQEFLNKIKHLHSLGLDNKEIGSEVGRCRYTVLHHLKKMGLKSNYPRSVYRNSKDKLLGTMIRNIKHSAKRRNIEFRLTKEDLILPTHCPVLGLELSYSGSPGFNKNDRATIDRIDNTKGYIPGNVWIISRLANTMKNSANLDQLKTFCEKIPNLIQNHRALGNITDHIGLDS